MRMKIREFYKQISFMQRRIKDGLVTKESKIEVLLNYWDKMFGVLQSQASKSNDKPTNDMCKKLIVIPKEVRYAMLKKYVTQCRNLYTIAFFQWRLMYPSQVRFEKEQLEVILYKCINDLIDGLNPKLHPSDETNRESMIPRDFLRRYSLADIAEQDFLVNRFWSIGMADPYPDDDLKIIGSRDDHRDFGLPTKCED